QGARNRSELGQVAQLEERVPGMRGQAAEEVRAQHRRHHRPVAAARLAHDAAVRGRVYGPVLGVHEGHHFRAQIAVIAAGARRVEELRTAVRGPAVDEDDHRRRAALVGEELVEQLVEAAPPRSPVRTLPSSQTASIARSIRPAPLSSPRWRSISAADQMAPIGLARPWPAMSGADPCTGSNMEGQCFSGLRLPEAHSPSDPWRAPPRSVRMSAKRLEPTTTSMLSGRSTMRAAMASTCTRSTVIAGWSR